MAITPAHYELAKKKLEELAEETGLLPALLLFDDPDNSFSVLMADSLTMDDLKGALHSLETLEPSPTVGGIVQ